MVLTCLRELDALPPLVDDGGRGAEAWVTVDLVRQHTTHSFQALDIR